MSFGALILLFILVRAFSNRGAGTVRLSSGQAVRPGCFGLLVRSLIGTACLSFAWLIGVVESPDATPWGAIALALAGALFLMPATILEPLAIATRSARVAHALVLRFGDRGVGLRHDPRGNAALAAVLAAIRGRPTRETDLDFVDAQVEGPSNRRLWRSSDVGPPFGGESPLLGSGLVAAGLAAFARGDHARARAILKSTSLFDPRFFRDGAQQVAWSWRAADCASRGEWRELFGWGMVEREGSLPFAFRLRTLRAVAAAAWKRDADALRAMGIDAEGVQDRSAAFRALLLARRNDMALEREDRLQILARRLLKRRRTRGFGRLAGIVGLRICAGRGAASRRELDIAWALCPRRFTTRSLVKLALESEPPKAEALRAGLAEVAAVRDPWERGVAAIAHASLVGPGLPLRGALTHEAAKAWNEAFAGETIVARIAERAAALGSSAGDEAVRALRNQAVEALVDATLEGEVESVAFAFDGPVSGPAFHRARERLLADLGALLSAIDARKRENQRLPAPDEWAAFTNVLDAYRRVAELGGPNARALAFTSAFPPLTNWAVWLQNGYRQRAIANAVYRWILEEAHVHANAYAVNLSLRNMRAALP